VIVSTSLVAGLTTHGLVLADSGPTAGQTFGFWVVAPLAVLGGLMMLLSRKAVHSALWLALTMICLALLYIMQGAVFLGVVQVVVYTGAVMMLFLFVLMLVGVDASDSLVETLRGQRVLAALAALGFGGLLVAAVVRSSLTPVVGVDAANTARGGNVQGIAELIFTRYLWAFEVTSALLITAAMGAMVLAHREHVTPKRTQRMLAEERIRGPQATPLPSPGVYARHNAVDTPGLLPDGTPSDLTIPTPLTERSDRRPPQRPQQLLTGRELEPGEGADE
jgi:NADH-quinone oxidoreductase subunit J